MASYEFFLVSSLEKVFPSARPREMRPHTRLSLWRGTRGAVQLVYRADQVRTGRGLQEFDLKITGSPVSPMLRHVRLIPSDYPCHETLDDDYFTKDPGLFPDLLEPMTEAKLSPLPRQYRSLWISWDIPADALPGNHEITITASAGKLVFENHFVLTIRKAELPRQKILHTEWFHPDCLANYYGVEAFSEEHWTILENFIHSAARHTVNLMLTPVFTLPLDTAVGGERLTTQLVEVRCDNGVYSFGFDKLARWVCLCRKYAIENLEIAHLYTQWGARATPKIIATVDGEEKRIFGWDVPATDGRYRRFLEAFLPALRLKLDELGYDRNHVYFHISDEPTPEQLEDYRAARNQTKDLLVGCHIIDALSSFEFYRQGIVKEPVVSTSHIQRFYDENFPDLWAYYCGGASHTPNRLFAMPSYRNRIMGVLMYLYQVKGFLHWGFNFYSTKHSIRAIDPYRVTHGGYWVPSGDTFVVYPGPDGTALDSLRLEVQDEAFLDLRAMQLLELLSGRQAVKQIILGLTDMDAITFNSYPRDSEYLLALREWVADAIDQALTN